MDGVAGGGGGSQTSARPAKRLQVATACNPCKDRKCDGRHPCQECSRRNNECVYETQGDETRRQAAKRKHDELSREHNELGHFIRDLATSGESEALEMFRLVRQGQKPEAIMRSLRAGHIDGHLTASHERQHLQTFLITLCQSTASLRDIVDLSTSFLNSRSRVNLPSDQAYQPLKETIITLEMLSGITSTRAVGHTDGVDLSSLKGQVDGSHDGPLYWLPGSFWTDLTDSDESVSHLVSLFLAHLNPYWRLVEEDLLLRAMRSCKAVSAYSSPLLVNAILACAAQYSEIDDAFAEPGQFLTRGQHFHDEAIRLWEMEAQRPSLTNIQALLVLTLESGVRGQDRLGTSFLKHAAMLNKRLPIPDQPTGSDLSKINYGRARRCLASTVVWFDLMYNIGNLRPPSSLSIHLDDAPDLSGVLVDSNVFWVGYPFKRRPIPFRLNLLTRKRQDLIHMMWELNHLLLSDNNPPEVTGMLWTHLDVLGERLRTWHQALPAELQPGGEMPASLFEFHAHYHGLQMILHGQAHEKLFGSKKNENANTSEMFNDLEYKLINTRLHYAFAAASSLADYRKSYGFKATSPFIIHQAAIALSIVLLDMHTRPHLRAHRHTAEAGLFNTRIRDSETAFGECFRCLLGSGMQNMLPRAISRMMYHTAMQLNVELPWPVKQMLQVVAETAWQPTDLLQLDSSYPNFAMVNGYARSIVDIGMENVLRQFEALAAAEDEAMLDVGGG